MNFEGVPDSTLIRLHPGHMTGTGGGKREIINRHEQRYSSSTNHTGLLNLPRA